MKKKNILFFVLSTALVLFTTGFLLNSRYHFFDHCALKKSENAMKAVYYCPMHPDFTSDKPGSCAICGMTLVKKEKGEEAHKALTSEKKILYYRNPMNPEVTSAVAMKDSMGMDYVPVYEDVAGAETSGIYISPQKQQLIGITKAEIQKRKLTLEIITVGRVAYDPTLFLTQEEYLQALKAREGIRMSSISSVKEQTEYLVEAAKKRLLLLGMSGQEIEDLAKRGTPQDNLYLTTNEDTAWVYITVYEYEMGSIREGLQVEIEAIAFPGEEFYGKIIAITPVLDATTRSIQVRAEVANPEHKLKPEMFVNARIKVDLGEKLAVPEAAVMDTGLRKIVYLANGGDRLEAREVILGQKAQDYFEVLQGLKEGDIVITSGNFLVDSESKLKSVLKDSPGETQK